MSKTLIIIAGPTATGKTALAIQLAKQFKTEIISADSRQFYREMNIGTAKPSKEELDTIQHHLIDSHSIVDYFSVGDFEKEVINLLKKLFKSHNQVVLVGGSGLFINAICNGFDVLPVATEAIRSELNKLLAEKGIMFIAVPNSDSWDAKNYKEHWDGYDVPRHIHHFNKKSIKKLFHDNGFEVIKMRGMWFDAPYISMRSEYHRGNGKLGFILGATKGMYSNLKALFTGNQSSILLIIKHK